MKNKSAILTLAAFAVLFAAQPAFAEHAKGHSVHARQQHQQGRISQGVKSGELTKGEAHRLERGEAKIAKDRQKALADGKVTAHERAKLQHEQTVQSRKIYKAKHNNKEVPVTAESSATATT